MADESKRAQVSLPPIPSRWRRRLGRQLRALAGRCDREQVERERRLEQAAQSYFRELKAAWRALDSKNDEIQRLQREIWVLGHPYGSETR